MRMYKVYHQDPDEGCILEWFEREDIAKAFYDKAGFGEDLAPHGVEVVDIPVSRLGLRDWLNEHMTRENG